MSENKPTEGPWKWDAHDDLVSENHGRILVAGVNREQQPTILVFRDSDRAAIAQAPETKAQRDELLAALTAIGVFPDGYCFCFGHIREPHKPEHEHTGECQAARAAIRRAQGGGDE